MRVFIHRLHVPIFAILIVAVGYVKCSKAQDASMSADKLFQAQEAVVTGGSDGESLQSRHTLFWYIPPIEEESRYWSFFREILGWEEVATRADAQGEARWAGHFRAMLAKQSSLTTEEAVQVKRVASEWKKGG